MDHNRQFNFIFQQAAGGAGGDLVVDSEIPKIIHLFWAGNKLPDDERNNLFSFARFLLPGWSINFWVTNPDILSSLMPKSPHIDSMGNKSYGCIKICNVADLLEVQDGEDVCYTLPNRYQTNPLGNRDFQVRGDLFKKTRELIEIELIGKSNFAAAKDACVPLILYKYGGYYFDLDTKVEENLEYAEIFSLSMPEGFLVLQEGRSIPFVAAKPNHYFSLITMQSILDAMQQDIVARIGDRVFSSEERPESFAGKTVGLCDILRNDTGIPQRRLREIATCSTFGQGIRMAWEALRNMHNNPYEFEMDSNILLSEVDRLFLGLEFNPLVQGGWRKKKQDKGWYDDSDLPDALYGHALGSISSHHMGKAVQSRRSTAIAAEIARHVTVAQHHDEENVMDFNLPVNNALASDVLPEVQPENNNVPVIARRSILYRAAACCLSAICKCKC